MSSWGQGAGFVTGTGDMMKSAGVHGQLRRAAGLAAGGSLATASGGWSPGCHWS